MGKENKCENTKYTEDWEEELNAEEAEDAEDAEDKFIGGRRRAERICEDKIQIGQK